MEKAGAARTRLLLVGGMTAAVFAVAGQPLAVST
jgi:hypothetical protein